MSIHRTQCPSELLSSAIAWETLRASYWDRPGFEHVAADCEARITFYQSRLNELFPEHLQ